MPGQVQIFKLVVLGDGGTCLGWGDRKKERQRDIAQTDHMPSRATLPTCI